LTGNVESQPNRDSIDNDSVSTYFCDPAKGCFDGALNGQLLEVESAT
jgi:hypothetical protein